MLSVPKIAHKSLISEDDNRIDYVNLCNDNDENWWIWDTWDNIYSTWNGEYFEFGPFYIPHQLKQKRFFSALSI